MLNNMVQKENLTWKVLHYACKRNHKWLKLKS